MIREFCTKKVIFYLEKCLFNKKIEMTEDKFLALCDWIDQHIDRQMGWAELSEFCGADHMELQAAFAKYKATTPMTWIRKRRQELNLGVELKKTTQVKLPPFLTK